MLFNSLTFPLFLLIVLVVFHTAPKRFQVLILLTSSYIFYGFWNWKFCGLLGLSTVVDYFCAQAMVRTVRRKKFLVISLVTNFGILALFKYMNFFIDSTAVLLSTLGLKSSFTSLEIILPVGISFYTFQTISYSIDVYRGKVAPTDNFPLFALYVSFFPQLVAGPIEKAYSLLPQLENLKPPTRPMISEGILLVVIGYFKKVVIGDQIAPIVDHAFANHASLSSIELWEGLFLFGMQIYFDFSGYSNIARGIAKFFGINLCVNFRQPYFSTNIAIFWRRWHISLSSWLKEYLYISLGGNRGGRLFTYRNLMITMLLGGLWHGAGWNFVFWGFLHGMFLIVHRLVSADPSSSSANWFVQGLKMFLTNVCVFMAWLPFRSPDLETTLAFATRMFAFIGPFDLSIILFCVLVALAMVVIDYPIYRSENEYILMRIPAIPRYIILAVTTLMVAILLTEGGLDRPFIYFQF